MMYKIKILKENKLLVESQEGLYDLMGIMPGSLDLFLDTFTSLNPIFKSSLRNFISRNFQNLIDGVTEQDLPPTGTRGYKTSLEKVKALLSSGVAFWWNELFGSQMVSKIIRFQVVSYYIELEERIEDIDYQGKSYSELTPEDFENLPEEDKRVIYEKHFWEDYLDSFFDNQMSVSADLGKGYVGGAGIDSGLYGQMNDWWMSTDGLDLMKSEMKTERDDLYKQFRKDTESPGLGQEKDPQWFAKGDSPLDDETSGYDSEAEAIAQYRKSKGNLDT
jgi:hypothetical protein